MQGPVQWPSPAGDTQMRHPIRYRPDPRLGPRFATDDGRARFLARPFLEAGERTDADYPFVLDTGRLQHHWHTLTKTGRLKHCASCIPNHSWRCILTQRAIWLLPPTTGYLSARVADRRRYPSVSAIVYRRTCVLHRFTGMMHLARIWRSMP